MHFWNYIKSASKTFETTSKVHPNDVVSKVHQKFIKSASSFLDISTCIFFLKMSACPSSQIISENRSIDVAQTDHSTSAASMHR